LAKGGSALDKTAAVSAQKELVGVMTEEQIAQGQKVSACFVASKRPSDHSTPQSLDLTKVVRAFRIVHLDDESWISNMLGSYVRRKFKNVLLLTFANGDEAWQELLREDPDLLITDLMNDNVPGKRDSSGKSGFELLALLAERNVKYPILVVSGSLAKEGVEAKARQIAGSTLNISFVQKPFTWQEIADKLPEQIYPQLLKHVKPTPILQSVQNTLSNYSESPAFFPHRMVFQMRGLMSNSDSYRLTHCGAGILEYRHAAEDNDWEDAIYLSPSSILWERFWRDLDSMNIWQWKAIKQSEEWLKIKQTKDFCDRESWQLDLDHGDQKVHSMGTSIWFDKDLRAFFSALQLLTGLQEFR
jgi:hypothetical protein